MHNHASLVNVKLESTEILEIIIFLFFVFGYIS